MLSACIAVGMMIGYKMNDKPENALISGLEYPTDSLHMTGRIEELIRFIENKYVDKINSNQLIEEALTGVFAKLDPHSLYLTPEETEDVHDQMEGAYFGIGIENYMIDDTVYISQVLENSPAQKSGLKSFDKIISIDDTPVAGMKMDYSEIRALLKKRVGDGVKLNIIRDGQLSSKTLSVGEIEIKSVEALMLKDIDAAWIKINRFGSNTYKEFMEEIEKQFDKGSAKHLILDLRGNPGGFLPEATNILCQIFEERDRLLLYTEGRNNKRNDYKTNGKRFFDIDNVVVLIDESSASASEIIAGAIQDWDRGIIIGRRSYGKGLVQEQYNLTNGGAIRLTVARYFTPSGRSIQRDYTDIDTYNGDFEDRRRHGDLFEKDSSLITNGGKYYTQILKREVSGAGGISPDIFVAMDSSYRDDAYFSLSFYIQEYAFRYAAKNKKGIPTDVLGFKKWEVSSIAINEFVSYVQSQDEEFSGLTPKDIVSVKRHIKDQISTILFKKNGLNKDYTSDIFVKEAIQVIKNKRTPADYR